MHHPALQPGIVIEKTNRAESKVRIFPRFTQDELPTPSRAVDERWLASYVCTLLHVVQDTIRKRSMALGNLSMDLSIFLLRIMSRAST